ncbi:MAG: CRISPR system precrRNA processing endoribonuclease RAMP protein Cas6 [Pseudomonadota bacterium]|nr:CRISPR system precrRNA processing endoribonuclease RAMP protein Cas6 [Pseudomonadota bacterium]
MPEYKGSTFRGVFGHALRSVVCALRRRSCADCLLATRCLYPFVFETTPADERKAPDGARDAGDAGDAGDARGARGARGAGGAEGAEGAGGAGGVGDARDAGDGGHGGEGGAPRRRIAARPHPYVIEAPSGERSRYDAGEIFSFNLLLFGQANDSLPYFIHAFNEVGKSGIGGRIGGQRAKFSLVSVTAAGRTLYDGATNRLYAGEVTEDLTGLLAPPPSGVAAPVALPDRMTAEGEAFAMAAGGEPGPFPLAADPGRSPAGGEAAPLSETAAANAASFSVSAPVSPGAPPRKRRPGATKPREEAPPVPEGLEVELLTPLRLKYMNRLGASLPFHVLIRASLRRVAALCHYYGDGEPALDYRGLTARAQAVAADETDLFWFDWERYSSRQDQRMLMGGITGRVRYTGEIGEFLPLLRFCEKVHLGKQTTFGLGRIRIKHP